MKFLNEIDDYNLMAIYIIGAAVAPSPPIFSFVWAVENSVGENRND